MRNSILLTICCCIYLVINAQQPDSGLLRTKLSPRLFSIKSTTQSDTASTWWITVTDTAAFKTFLAQQELPVKITAVYAPANLLVIQTTHKILINNILKTPWVTFADQPRQPREEQAINTMDNTTNQVNTVHGRYPSFNGLGLTVSVKENKPDTTDIDFKGRYLPTPLSSPDITQHAGIVSTIIGGGGNSDHTGRGAAWGATLSSSNFASLLPDANSAYQQYQISVQNHSYGTGIENYYGADAAAYDASSLANPSLLHIFSAGNAGNQTSTQGPYAGIPNYANITGSFKMGKNMITVGAINGLYQPEALGSKGPAYDGRVKPELVAFGVDGSSGAAAITSGIALLVQQACKNKTGQLPPASLVKSILLNTADDIATPGIDFQTGYGSVNAIKAVQAAQQDQYTSGSVSQAQAQNIPLTIPAGIKQLKITLCWYDPPATPNAPKALINDIDLELVNTNTGEHWQPWVLNHAANAASLAQLPARKRDSLNNNEQIIVDNPAPGTYTIQIRGYDIPSGTQSFAVAWSLDTADRFRWYYPVKADYIRGSENNTLRWSATFNNPQPARLDYSTDGGNQWQQITNDVDLTKGYYTWSAPDRYTTALLKITIGNQSFISDTFTISTRLKATTGFNCPDSFLLTWNKPAGVDRFIVYSLGNQYLAPLVITNDTAMVLKKSVSPSLHYTVAPLLSGTYTSMKAYTFDYTTQGVSCYIKNFLADLVNNKASLQIELGTRHAIQKIIVEKLGTTGYNTLQTVEPVNSLQYELTDNNLQRGINTYRLKIQRTDGSVIYSQSETVYNFGEATYILFPNPVAGGSLLNILTAIPGNSTLTLYNTAGQQVLHRRLQELHEQLPLRALQKGTYFYIIRKEGKKEQTGSILVY
ncbi:MAG: S8 family peptidase [Niastella sp.]|nr:S8 family peptidase [Niastella sp.]